MRVRVATYNVHACVGRDRRQDISRIVRVLREIDADVIGLQEVESRRGRSDVDQAQTIAAKLDMACVEGPLLLAERGWYGNALLSRLEVRSVRRVLFDRHGKEKRGAVVCDLLGSDAICWRVLTTHLDLHARHRRRQFAALLEELVPSRHQPTVLLGDFNEWSPLSRGMGTLRRYAELPPAPPTFPSWWPMLRLDRIAYAASRLRGEVRCHLTPQSRLASDHLPLFADLIADPVVRPAALETAPLGTRDSAGDRHCRHARVRSFGALDAVGVERKHGAAG